MSISLAGPEGSVVFSGTWQSARIPTVHGTVKCLLPTTAGWASFANTPVQTEGYTTFDGCYRTGRVCKLVYNITPGATPPGTAIFATCCDGGNCVEMSVTSTGVDTITLSYQSHQPLDNGTVTLTKESDATTLSFIPKAGKCIYRGMI